MAIQGLNNPAEIGAIAEVEPDPQLRGMIWAVAAAMAEPGGFHKIYALCDSCSSVLIAPTGYWAVPKGYSQPYLLCEDCFNRGWREGHSAEVARDRARVWWKTGDSELARHS